MPSQAFSRRDPQKGKKGFSITRGFTLIELMVVIAVVAIITSFALPSYRTLIEKRQVTSGAEQLGALLSSVQIEAVKRSENITVSYNRTDAANWCVGMVSGTAACDCTETDPAQADCKIDGEVRVLQGSYLNYPGIMFKMNGDGSYVFDPARGLVYTDGGMAAYDSAEFELLSEDGTYALNVQVSPTGRVKFCSNEASTKVPGYPVCVN